MLWCTLYHGWKELKCNWYILLLPNHCNPTEWYQEWQYHFESFSCYYHSNTHVLFKFANYISPVCCEVILKILKLSFSWIFTFLLQNCLNTFLRVDWIQWLSRIWWRLLIWTTTLQRYFFLNLLKVISRKIWVTEKFCNFHIVDSHNFQNSNEPLIRHLVSSINRVDYIQCRNSKESLHFQKSIFH